jgi:hypothetical protein
LQLPQHIIAQAIVIFTRSWISQDGLSLRDHAVKVSQTGVKVEKRVLTLPRMSLLQ